MKIVENQNPMFSIIKGVLISFLFTIIVLTVYSLLLVYTDLSEETIKPVIITVTGISILVGSSFGTRNLNKNGLKNGAIIGAMYILIIYLISSAINSCFTLNLVSVIMIACRFNWRNIRTE